MGCFWKLTFYTNNLPYHTKCCNDVTSPNDLKGGPKAVIAFGTLGCTSQLGGPHLLSLLLLLPLAHVLISWIRERSADLRYATGAMACEKLKRV